MNTNCCVTSVPHHGSFKVLAKAVGAWQERLRAGLSWSIEASDQPIGHLEEEVFQQTRELQPAVLADVNSLRIWLRASETGKEPSELRMSVR
jgi:hypothetical protein